jgi:hypothetical protein
MGDPDFLPRGGDVGHPGFVAGIETSPVFLFATCGKDDLRA